MNPVTLDRTPEEFDKIRQNGRTVFLEHESDHPVEINNNDVFHGETLFAMWFIVYDGNIVFYAESKDQKKSAWFWPEQLRFK